MRKFFTAVLAACLLLALSACGEKKEPAPPEVSPDTESAESPSAPEVEILPEPQDPLLKQLESMSLEEKVGQLFFVRCPAENAVEDVSAYHLGGYILFGRDTKEKTANDLIQTIAAYQAEAEIPLLIGVDEEGGTVVRVSSNPHLRSARFTSPQKLFADGGMEAVRADAEEKSLLLKALGFNVNLAPVVDISTNPDDFIYDRSFGQDAAATEAFAREVISVMSAQGMGSVLKHFPGYGGNVDTHTGIAVDSRPLETLESQDLLPFRAHNAGNGMSAILFSHNIIACMDDTLPASLSLPVHTYLRETMGFDGVIMTDDLAMAAVAAYAEDGAVAVMAIEAGNDIVLTTDYRTQIPKVIEAVESGRLAETAIDEACLRVLRWKAALGLLEL